MLIIICFASKHKTHNILVLTLCIRKVKLNILKIKCCMYKKPFQKKKICKLFKSKLILVNSQLIYRCDMCIAIYFDE